MTNETFHYHSLEIRKRSSHLNFTKDIIIHLIQKKHFLEDCVKNSRGYEHMTDLFYITSILRVKSAITKNIAVEDLNLLQTSLHAQY